MNFFFLGESDEISTVVPMEATKSTNNYRYFSLTDEPRILLPKNLFVKARAVYVAACDDSIFGKELKERKTLAQYHGGRYHFRLNTHHHTANKIS